MFADIGQTKYPRNQFDGSKISIMWDYCLASAISHWDLDKMAAIFQKTFSNVLSLYNRRKFKKYILDGPVTLNNGLVP